MTHDLDGDVEQYHVEFLGDPHSRTWIDAEFVGHYSIKLKPEKCKKISGIRVPYKKHTSCMDVLMSKGWKDATYQNRTHPKQLAKLLWWPRKGCKFPKITLKRKIPNLEKGKGKLF